MATTDKVNYMTTSKITANQLPEENSLLPERVLIVPSIFSAKITGFNDFSGRGNYVF